MNLPIEFRERMKKLLGDEYESFLRSYDTKIYQGIRINTLKSTTVNETAKKLKLLENIPWCENGFYADKSDIS